jgi:hypothetical protein
MELKGRVSNVVNMANGGVVDQYRNFSARLFLFDVILKIECFSQNMHQPMVEVFDRSKRTKC